MLKTSLLLRKVQTLRVTNSRILTIKNVKFWGYYCGNLNIWGDFQICITLPLKMNIPKSMFNHTMSITRGISMLMVWNSMNWMKSKAIPKSMFGHSMWIKTIKLNWKTTQIGWGSFRLVAQLSIFLGIIPHIVFNKTLGFLMISGK